MHSSIEIDIAASPREVFELARDVERWPQLLPHYARVSVRARSVDRVLAQMVAIRQVGPIPVPVTWRAVCWSDATHRKDLRLHFRHTRGVSHGMEVTWHIRPAASPGTGSHVTIEHEFSRRLPLVGSDLLPRFIDRFFTRPIASRTLGTFKVLAEARHPESVAPTN